MNHYLLPGTWEDDAGNSNRGTDFDPHADTIDD